MKRLLLCLFLLCTVACTGGGKIQYILPSLAEIQSAAQNGDMKAQYSLAKRYSIGMDVPESFEWAFYWYKKSAEQGFAPAQHMLGEYYVTGDLRNFEDLPPDVPAEVGDVLDYVPTEATRKQAFYWNEKAAQQGIPMAQFRVGDAYFEGAGTAKNLPKALYWYQKSADAGIHWAQYALGKCYAEGIGVPQNSEKAVYWLRKASEQQNSDAVKLLRSMCRSN